MGDCVSEKEGSFSMPKFNRAKPGHEDMEVWVKVEIRLKIDDQKVESFVQPQSICRRSPLSSHCLQHRSNWWSLNHKSLTGVRYHQRGIF